MFLSRLQLTHFRNFHYLDLAFDRAFTVLQGPNGAGKTNLLDAVCYLATSRSHKSQTDAQSIATDVSRESIPYFQIEGHVQDGAGLSQLLRVYYGPRELRGRVAKILQANGERLPARNLMGRLRAVLFIPEDTRLVSEGPGVRRRYLDITLCQVDRNYFDALLQYQKVLKQRNALLKQLRAAGHVSDTARVTAETRFWDESLIRYGVEVTYRRAQWLQQLVAIARSYHTRMTHDREYLDLVYRPSIRPRGSQDAKWQEPVGITREEWQESFGQRLHDALFRDLGQSATSVGPHRDDFLFRSNDLLLSEFGSRGQQRTAVIAYRLAEVEGIRQQCRESPLLLLDDVMSELDDVRRTTVVEVIRSLDQVIMTTTDWSHYTDDFLGQASCWKVRNGTLVPA